MTNKQQIATERLGNWIDTHFTSICQIAGLPVKLCYEVSSKAKATDFGDYTMDNDKDQYNQTIWAEMHTGMLPDNWDNEALAPVVNNLQDSLSNYMDKYRYGSEVSLQDGYIMIEVTIYVKDPRE